MEEQELLKRAEDLSVRSVKKWEITHTAFLTPAEKMLLQKRFHPEPGCEMRFYGGYEDAERSIAVFRPEDSPEPESGELLRAVHYKAYFGEPGHRDYLGALIASGISRDRLGDIVINGEEAWVFCLPGIVSHLTAIDRIGRISVRAEEIPPEKVPSQKRETKSVSFTVQSMRVDAVAAGMFHLSRSKCADCIREGLLSLNYSTCEKTDTEVREGDIISLRGCGKGVVTELGGNSRKGRQFVQAELYR